MVDPWSTQPFQAVANRSVNRWLLEGYTVRSVSHPLMAGQPGNRLLAFCGAPDHEGEII